ncbi:type II secretion system protein [Oleiharenicola lentus]|uniref:type II secretion system protein n=1 Tax=Oleiharenicola lentus TaxID=2508720 RepID=UPI003F6661D1
MKRTAPSRYGFQKGFTLVEIMIVVVIIGLLSAMAIPAFKHVRESAQNSRITNDFRIFSQAFETHALDNAGWPANSSAGVVPAGMSGSFSANSWQAITPLGGRWNWDRDNFGVSAGISISGFTCTVEQITALDKRMDDGDLSTGRLKLTASNRVTWELEPQS